MNPLFILYEPNIHLSSYFTFFDDLSHQVVAAELRHQVYALRPWLNRFDQLHRQFDTDFRPFLPGSFHLPVRLLRDGDARHFVVQETGVASTDKRQNAHQHRLVERAMFGSVFLKKRRTVLGTVDWLGQEEIRPGLDLAA